MKFSKKLLLTQVVALAAASAAFAGGHVPSMSGLVSRGYPVLNPMVSNSVDGFGVNNELFLLTQRQSGAVKDGVLYVNGRLVASATYARSKVTISKVNGSSANSYSAFQVPSADLAVTATKGAATVFVELSNEVMNATTGSTYNHVYKFAKNAGISDANASGINVKQAYLMLGDLNKSPLYLVAGRKTVDYGSFDNLDWFWQPVTNFWSPGSQDQVAVGVYQNGLHAAWTFFNGKTMTHSGNVSPASFPPSGASNNIANWALTASYGAMVKQVGAELGVSYINGLVNDGSHNYLGTGIPYSIAHNVNFRNPAGVVFGKLSYKPVSLSASYHQAFRKNSASKIGVPGILEDYKPRAWDVTGKVDFNFMGRSNWLAINYSESKVLSQPVAGKLEQLLVGWNMALTDSISATLEYGHQVDRNYTYDINNGGERDFSDTKLTDNFVNLSLYAYF